MQISKCYENKAFGSLGQKFCEPLMNRISISIENNLADVGLLGVCIRSVASFAFIPEQCAEIELAVVEAVNNIIKHTYAHLEKAQLNVVYSLFEDKAVIEVIDYGQAMAPNRLAEQDKAFDFDLENIYSLPESGMGLMLIKSCMSEVSYVSEDSCNRMILIKHRTV